MASAGRRTGPGWWIRRCHRSLGRRDFDGTGALAALAGALMGAATAIGQPAADAPVNVTGRPPQPAKPSQPPPPVNVTAREGVGRGGQPVSDVDGPSYAVSAFVLRYGQDTQGLPLLQSVARTEVELGKLADGYVAPREGVPTVRMRIADAADRGAERYYASAIAAVTRAILDDFNRRGLIGVLVTPSDEDIRQPDDRTAPDWGKDLRPAGKTDLTLLIRVGLVKEVRTLAAGERVPADERVNNPLHKRIRVNSPVRTIEAEAAVGRRDVLRREMLDEYLFRLNRYPGRHVDASLAPAEDAGGVVLDYLVNENKPWTIYGQASNTGTRQTNEWREKIGFINNQLTANDDTLSLEYVTAGFQESHAIVGSYEAPLLWMDRLRWRVYGSWDQYTASDVGQSGQNFKGDDWGAGGELVDNIYQRGELFVDLFGGARWMHVKVNNELVAVEGENDFFLPYFGVKAERTTDVMSSSGSIKFEFQCPQIAGTDRSQLNTLGRLNADANWTTMQWDITHSMYLEPLLFPTSFRDPESGAATLAHELAASFRGQYAFGYRLIPNSEQVVGGMYSVRGYPESVVAGDTALVGSVEYRFHIPRALGIQPDATQTPLFGEPFRFRPQQPYGRADWDLVAKAFFDVGQTIISDRLPFEHDRTLLGTGVGLEFQFKRNVMIRADWGVALKDVPGEASAGDSRLHFSATILY